MDRLGIDFITMLGMPLVDFVAAAADLGIGRVGIAPKPLVANPYGYPEWSLLEDKALRAVFREAAEAAGVKVGVCDLLVFPGMDVAEVMPARLDMIVEVGGDTANVATLQPDFGQAKDEIALFGELAAARGLKATLEFAPLMGIKTIAAAREAHRHSGNRVGILVDMLHVSRSNGTTAELKAIPASEVGYIQLCDAPAAWTQESYADEASNNRMAPGEGELPLVEWMAALPRDVDVGMEIPMARHAEAGLAPKEYLAPTIAACRSLLDQVANVPA